MKTKIKNIKIGDIVEGPSGPVKVTNIVESYIPNRMFKMKFDIGTVKCSGNHLWRVFSDDKYADVDAEFIFGLSKENKDKLKFGVPNGPKLKSIKEVRPRSVCCIKVDSEDHLFGVVLRKGIIFTHNCQFRMACGRLASIPSMMLFGNTMATTIDGSHPGSGMISANGSISRIQYYYEEIKWINQFYKKCGFDEFGFRKNNMSLNKNSDHKTIQNSSNEKVEESNTDEDTNAIDELDNIFDFKHDIQKIEVEGLTGEVDKTKRQKFE